MNIDVSIVMLCILINILNLTIEKVWILKILIILVFPIVFFENIYIKSNIAEKLDIQLSKTSWKNEMIAIGTVTDSYQPIEKEYELMPDVLNTLIKHKNPAVISTKSDLIFRDLDLINELSEINFINIAVTITSLDDKIQKLIEPNTISSKKEI